MSGAVLQGLPVSGAVLQGLPVSGAVLQGLPVSGAVLQGLLVSGAVLQGLPVGEAVLRALPASAAATMPGYEGKAFRHHQPFTADDISGRLIRGGDGSFREVEGWFHSYFVMD